MGGAWVLACAPSPDQGFFLPTGQTKPPPTGSGKPDRFDRLPKKPGQIQISNKNDSSIGLH
jgi:hypothetical protein